MKPNQSKKKTFSMLKTVIYPTICEKVKPHKLYPFKITALLYQNNKGILKYKTHSNMPAINPHVQWGYSPKTTYG